ncbi:MAG: ribonuclease HII [Candidatus Aenigmatarchaeota archaeon]
MGPLVMCGYMINESDTTKLKEIGVKDSKLLSAKQRTDMRGKLEDIAEDIVVLKVSASDIDSTRSISNMNRLEIEKMLEIINMLEPDKVIIDAIESNTKRFREKVASKLDKKDTILIAENFADKKYPVVSAASIIAKLHRDEEIKKMHITYGNFGSGYTHDEATIGFLKSWMKKNKEFPHIVRKSWITAVEIKNNSKQKNIQSFLNTEE